MIKNFFEEEEDEILGNSSFKIGKHVNIGTPGILKRFNLEKTADLENQPINNPTLLLPLPRPVTKEHQRNKKLVSLLKQKMFKGFMKIKASTDFKTQNEASTTSYVYASGQKFKVRLKSNIEREDEDEEKENLAFLKIHKYTNEQLFNMMNLKKPLKFSKTPNATTNSSIKLFVTEKFNNTKKSSKKISRDLESRHTDKYEESVPLNKLSFLAFDVKQPDLKDHFSGHKAKLEKEILKEIELLNKNNISIVSELDINAFNETKNNDNTKELMGKTSKSENLFQSEKSILKNKTNKGYMNFQTNRGVVKGFITNKLKTPNLNFDIAHINLNDCLYNSSPHHPNEKGSDVASFNNETHKRFNYKSAFALKQQKQLIQFSNEQLRQKNNLLGAISTISKPVQIAADKMKHNLEFLKELTSFPDTVSGDVTTEKVYENDVKYLRTEPKINDSGSFVVNKLSKTKNIQYRNKIKLSKDNLLFANNTFNAYSRNDSVLLQQKHSKHSLIKRGRNYKNKETTMNPTMSASRFTMTGFTQKTYEKNKSKEDILNRQNRSRDYNITKHLYKMYDKEDVDKKIYGFKL